MFINLSITLVPVALCLWHLSVKKDECAFLVSKSETTSLCPCQNMLLEIEQKVSYLSELSVHSESLLLEGRAETKGEAEQLTLKLRSLKDSLVELQQMLQDKQVDIQVRSLFLLNSKFSLPSINAFHKHSFVPLCVFSLPVPGSGCVLLHCVTQCSHVNGGIVWIAKVMSVSFRKVQCFPHWASNSTKNKLSRQTLTVKPEQVFFWWDLILAFLT